MKKSFHPVRKNAPISPARYFGRVKLAGVRLSGPAFDASAVPILFLGLPAVTQRQELVERLVGSPMMVTVIEDDEPPPPRYFDKQGNPDPCHYDWSAPKAASIPRLEVDTDEAR
ncbi:hypothetical protein [Niveispirillum sp. BGYR6]|uniref:hypothetical protein n=1 Tax=Niveispirillum sp. BGYR6 TaxID=2971249 RepID=UPI0022B961A5|nr:hypothetical protein [Niveispirillum sp. BGYR6]MDG5494351.1 hypothetical protein [Niveispirillum sp. BGYR6]